MNVQDPAIDWAVQKFGIGQPVPRTEDPKLVRGQGSYTDDVRLSGQAFAAMVRSPHPHARIGRIDLARALEVPGVRAIITGRDLLGMIGPLSSIVKAPLAYYPIAIDKARYVGEPVAVVVAETAAQAREAAEAVAVEIEPLPAVTKASEAAKPGAPALYEEAPDNVALNYHYGEAEKVADAFARAAHVVRLEFVNSRVVVNAMEPRAAVAEYDGKSESFTLHVGSQGAFGMRGQLAGSVGL